MSDGQAPEIPNQVGQYSILEILGSGAFATVYKAQHIFTMTPVAIKVIPKKNLRNKVEFELLQREVSLIKSMDHPFIAMFYEALDDDKNFYLVQELVENGNLLDYVNACKGLSERQAAHIFIQLISVLDYLHNVRHVAHRDLKAENVLLDRNNNVRLVDFGLSKAFTRDDPFLKTTCGSPAYVAPEIIREQPYTAAADIWSTGILLYAMTVGQLPFSGDNISYMLQQILLVNPRMPHHLSPSLRNLLERLLVKEPNTRITISEIENHPWVSGEPEACLFSTEKRVDSLKVVDPQHLDSGVISEMRILGIDTSGLVQELTANQINSRTAVYKMLRRQKSMDELNNWNQGGQPIPNNAFQNSALPPLSPNKKDQEDHKKGTGILPNATGLRRPGDTGHKAAGPRMRARKLNNRNSKNHPIVIPTAIH